MDSFLVDPAYPTLSCRKNVLPGFWDEGHTAELVYLDFAKAFDSVNHRFLLAKLSATGIDGAVLNWIKSYLSNPNQNAFYPSVNYQRQRLPHSTVP